MYPSSISSMTIDYIKCYVYRSILYIQDKAKRLCYRCSKNPLLPEFLGEQNVVGRKLEIPAGYDGYILLLQKG